MIPRRSYLKRSKPPARRSRPRTMRRGKRAAEKRSLAYLWRVKVRAKNGGQCVIRRLNFSHVCWGPIQAAHCFGVDEAPAVRLALWNGEPVCAEGHEFYERRKTAWRGFLFQLWGPYLYAERLGLARSTVKVDLDAARQELSV